MGITEQFRISNAAFFELLRSREKKGELVKVAPERWLALRNETEIRAVSAGCKPMSEMKQVATEVEGWRDAR